MRNYVVLNFEDKITDTNKGAADSTILGLKNRYEVRKQPKGLKKLFGANTVNEHRCVNANPIGFNNDPARLATIRKACFTAEKIYLVMHGDPRNTEICYTNAVGDHAGVVPLVSALQLANFLSTVLTAGKEYKLALIMCYGARCRNYLSANVNHQGMIPQADLVTSFAYRLYYALVHTHSINAKLSAVTGKISHESTTGNAMVEVEEMIDLNMEFSETQRAKITSMKAAVGGELKAENLQDATYKQNFANWKTSAEGSGLIKRVKDVQDARNETLASLPPSKGSGTMNKYGKIEYRYISNVLTIISKYGDAANQMAAGTVLYKGPLLPPG